MHPVIENNKKQIIELCKNHHVKELYAFGSVTRDDFDEKSDVDFVINYEKDNAGMAHASFDYFDFWFALEDITGCKVDLVVEQTIKNKYFKQSVEKEKILLYVA